MKHFFTAFLTIFTLVFTSCDKNEPGAQPFSNASCDTGKVVKLAKDRVGSISYNPAEDKYLISYHEPGTYDTVDIGYTCNLPEKFRQADLKVIFSGYYRPYPVAAGLGGYTNYYLELTKISLK